MNNLNFLGLQVSEKRGFRNPFKGNKIKMGKKLLA